jgi:hypothetical protein
VNCMLIKEEGCVGYVVMDVVLRGGSMMCRVVEVSIRGRGA